MKQLGPSEERSNSQQSPAQLPKRWTYYSRPAKSVGGAETVLDCESSRKNCHESYGVRPASGSCTWGLPSRSMSSKPLRAHIKMAKTGPKRPRRTVRTSEFGLEDRCLVTSVQDRLWRTDVRTGPHPEGQCRVFTPVVIYRLSTRMGILSVHDGSVG